MKKIRVSALLLMLVMLFGMVAACGNEDGTTAATEGDSTTGSEETTEYVYKMPITDDTTTISIWRSFSSTLVADPNEVSANKSLEENTNVHVEWVCASTTSAQEQFNIMIVSQEYQDAIMARVGNAQEPAYTGGVDKAIADGVYIDVADYLQYAPTFVEYFESNENIAKQCTTDGGAIFMNNVQSGEQPSWCGPMVRQDWLDELGMSTPETYDDWYNMLTAFKNDLGVSNALFLSQDGYSSLANGLTAGYDTTGSFYNQDGTVKYGFIDEGFREYLTMINQWYKEGLVDQDFYTRTGTDAQTQFLQDKVGAMDMGVYTYAGLWPAMHPDDGVELVAVPFPTKTAGSEVHFRNFNEICGTTPIFPTTAAVEDGNIETLMRWLDYRYADEGAFICNYGTEGLTWEMGDDGLPHFNDFFLHNDEYTLSDMTTMHCDSTYGGYYMWIRENDQYTEEVLEGPQAWVDSSSGDWMMPPVTLTAEEASEYATIYGDIETYVNESVMQFITGIRSLDEWDEYVSMVENMNIARCIEIYQDALDRYNAR